MGAALGLLAALAYGTSDFLGGLGSRRSSVVAVTGIAQPASLLISLLSFAVVRGHAPTAASLAWGAVSGLGAGVGTVALYWGLCAGAMNVVAPLSAVVSAVLPALVGLAIGEHLSGVAIAGVVLAVPALLAVSRQPRSVHGPAFSASLLAGLLAGAGFALLFVALDQAGTAYGAWPLLASQVVSTAVIAGYILPRLPARAQWRTAWPMALAAGATAGTSNVLYFVATGLGQLAVIAVLTALYPAATVMLASAVLKERLGPIQIGGLLAAGVAVALVTRG